VETRVECTFVILSDNISASRFRLAHCLVMRLTSFHEQSYCGSMRFSMCKCRFVCETVHSYSISTNMYKFGESGMVSRETTPGLDIAADVLHSTEGYRRRSRFLIDLPTFLIISNHGTSQRSFSTPQPSNSNSDTDLSTDTLIAATPSESGTPVVVNSRDRNGTIIARPTWDKYPTLLPTTTVQSQTAPRTRRLTHHRELPPESPSDRYRNRR
jgi:hypothetical protein